MKRPAFQFYPADWSKDLALRSCSLAAQGLWMQMLCMAHESERYGFLILNGKTMTDAQVVNAVPGAARKMLIELEEAGVFSRDASGTIYSRRMVRDEHLRTVRAACGQLGGNPNLVGCKVKQKPTKTAKEVRDKDNVFPTPSVSSSVVLPTGVATSIEPGAVDKSAKPEGDKSPESQNRKARPPSGWHKSNEGIEAAARTVGITPAPGELHLSLKRRVFDRLAEWERDEVEAA